MYTDKQIQELIPDGTLISISRVGREIQAVTVDGKDVTDMIRRWCRKRALDSNSGLVCRHTRSGGVQWRQVDKAAVDRAFSANVPVTPAVAQAATVLAMAPSKQVKSAWTPMDEPSIRDFIKSAMKYKPSLLSIPEVAWKYLVRSAIRGKNILLVGPSGCGKTLACTSVAKAFPNRPFAAFNLGASQDPRGMLIGNTHYDKAQGTFFSESLFCQMIQTPGAIILLDEISRSHDDASNILMTVLDESQRYLRIDEKPDTPTIKVAEGVTFLSTANVGNEYTGARVMDRAMLDRFVIVEMTPLNKEQESTLLKSLFADVEAKTLEAIADIAAYTRDQVKSEDPKINTIISTRATVEMAGLIRDGFTLADAAEVCVFPFYPSTGGAESERTHMKQVVQKFLPTDYDDKKRPWDDKNKAAKSDDENKVPW